MKKISDHEMTLLSNCVYPPLVPNSSIQEGCPTLNPQTTLQSHLPEAAGPICKPRHRRKRPKGGFCELKKRMLTVEQASYLEVSFTKEQKLKPERKALLAAEMGLDPRQVAVWFQNRRVRQKNQQMEEDYQRIKDLYEEANREKCKLTSEEEIHVNVVKRKYMSMLSRSTILQVVKLKEMLAEAENEVRNLTAKNRSSSAVSFDAQHEFGVAFEVDQQDNYLMFTSENGSIFSYTDWNDALYYGLL